MAPQRDRLSCADLTRPEAGAHGKGVVMRSRFRCGDWFLVGALIIGSIAALLSLVEIVRGRDEIFLLFVCFFVVALLACGFLLYRFAGDNCPECGRTIPPGEQWRDP